MSYSKIQTKVVKNTTKNALQQPQVYDKIDTVITMKGVNMDLAKSIYQIRTGAKLTQAQFSELFGVSQQAVQKWENGTSLPDMERIVKIAKYFDVSLDALILCNDNRVVEEMNRAQALKPQYQNIHDWEFYSSNLKNEYEQSIEECLDIEA